MGLDTTAARQKMVDNQIRTVDVTAHSVLRAFLSVKREHFLPSSLKPLAYIDTDLKVAGEGASARYAMEPAPLAKLLQLCAIGKEDVVLEIGAGTGYVSALLSMMAGSVVSVESDGQLAARATEALAEDGYDNVAVVTGPLEAGWSAEAPYDVIFLNGSVDFVPQGLLDQLREGGRLVAVIGEGLSSKAHLFVREHGVASARAVFNTSIKPLPGFRKTAEFVF